MVERYEQPTDRFEKALMLILRKTSGSCETFTSGIGSCYKNGRFADAKFGSDMACDSCIAHRALFHDDLPLTG